MADDKKDHAVIISIVIDESRDIIKCLQSAMTRTDDIESLKRINALIMKFIIAFEELNK